MPALDPPHAGMHIAAVLHSPQTDTFPYPTRVEDRRASCAPCAYAPRAWWGRMCLKNRRNSGLRVGPRERLLAWSGEVPITCIRSRASRLSISWSTRYFPPRAPRSRPRPRDLNLGRSDLPTFSFTIESFAVPVDDGNDLAWTGRLVWGKGRHIRSVSWQPSPVSKGFAASDAQHWLEDYLTMNGGVAESAKIKKAAHAAGHTERSVRTARTRLKVEIISYQSQHHKAKE
jgi:hypothetical protein